MSFGAGVRDAKLPLGKVQLHDGVDMQHLSRCPSEGVSAKGVMPENVWPAFTDTFFYVLQQQIEVSLTGCIRLLPVVSEGSYYHRHKE